MVNFMENMDKINLDEIELSKVKFNSKKNLTEMLDSEFLDDLNQEFGDINCISIVLNISSDEKPQTPKLIILNHKNDDAVINKVITAEFNAINSSENDDSLKKVINLLIK